MTCIFNAPIGKIHDNNTAVCIIDSTIGKCNAITSISADIYDGPIHNRLSSISGCIQQRDEILSILKNDHNEEKDNQELKDHNHELTSSQENLHLKNPCISDLPNADEFTLIQKENYKIWDAIMSAQKFNNCYEVSFEGGLFSENMEILQKKGYRIKFVPAYIDYSYYYTKKIPDMTHISWAKNKGQEKILKLLYNMQQFNKMKGSIEIDYNDEPDFSKMDEYLYKHVTLNIYLFNEMVFTGNINKYNKWKQKLNQQNLNHPNLVWTFEFLS